MLGRGSTFLGIFSGADFVSPVSFWFIPGFFSCPRAAIKMARSRAKLDSRRYRQQPTRPKSMQNEAETYHSECQLSSLLNTCRKAICQVTNRCCFCLVPPAPGIFMFSKGPSAAALNMTRLAPSVARCSIKYAVGSASRSRTRFAAKIFGKYQLQNFYKTFASHTDNKQDV